MISSVAFTSPGSAVAITMVDGTVWHDDAALPPDTALRRDLAEWTASGGAITPYAAPPIDLYAYAAAKRWAVQSGGISVGGVSVDTGDASRSMIADAVAYVQAAGGASIAFKATSGWVTLTSGEVVAIGLAVGAHVQACFAAERAIAAAISAGTVTTTAEIDAWAWPS